MKVDHEDTNCEDKMAGMNKHNVKWYFIGVNKTGAELETPRTYLE